MDKFQNRSLYTDWARQDFSTWLRRKESQPRCVRRDANGDLVAVPELDSDWTRAIAMAAIAGGQPQEWRLETLTFNQTGEGSDIEEDCGLLRRAIDLIGGAEDKVVIDNDLSQFVARNFAPGWMLVVFEHPEGELSIIASAIPDDCGIETFDPDQLYCEMLEGGIDALQHPDGQIIPHQ